MKKNKQEPKSHDCRVCSSWDEIVSWVDQFPLPNITISEDGEIDSRVWAFRGVKDSDYALEPSVERHARSKGMDWAALESLVSSEFKARARAHLAPSLIPEDELTWLALMQHYAVPTRLLDFTYSPYVALYFGIRNSRKATKGKHLRLYAVNVTALNSRFERVAYEAEREGKGEEPRQVSFDPDTFGTDRDFLMAETEGLLKLIVNSMTAEGKRRRLLNSTGAACATAPPAFNPRLASQQGLFLLNCAEQLNLGESLVKMMDNRRVWQTTVDIPLAIAPKIEEKLFNMNIHDQSLFPDLEGLSGFIRQKIRLQWK